MNTELQILSALQSPISTVARLLTDKSITFIHVSPNSPFLFAGTVFSKQSHLIILVGARLSGFLPFTYHGATSHDTSGLHSAHWTCDDLAIRLTCFIYQLVAPLHTNPFETAA
jgi:hypothetical protein